MQKKALYGCTVLDKNGKSIVQTVDMHALINRIAAAHVAHKAAAQGAATVGTTTTQAAATAAGATIPTTAIVFATQSLKHTPKNEIQRPLAVQPQDIVISTGTKPSNPASLSWVELKDCKNVHDVAIVSNANNAPKPISTAATPVKELKHPLLAPEDQDKFEVGLITRLPPTQDFTFECPYPQCQKLAYIESMVACGIIRHGSIDALGIEPIPPHASEADVQKLRSEGKVHNGCGLPLTYVKENGKEYIRPCLWELAHSKSLQ